jgi:hypothetical protein
MVGAPDSPAAPPAPPAPEPVAAPPTYALPVYDPQKALLASMREEIVAGINAPDAGKWAEGRPEYLAAWDIENPDVVNHMDPPYYPGCEATVEVTPEGRASRALPPGVTMGPLPDDERVTPRPGALLERAAELLAEHGAGPDSPFSRFADAHLPCPMCHDRTLWRPGVGWCCYTCQRSYLGSPGGKYAPPADGTLAEAPTDPAPRPEAAPGPARPASPPAPAPLQSQAEAALCEAASRMGGDTPTSPVSARRGRLYGMLAAVQGAMAEYGIERILLTQDDLEVRAVPRGRSSGG